MKEVKNLKFNKKYIVAMANDFVMQPQILSINSLRIFRTLISNIQKNDKDFFAYKFKASDIASFWGLHDNTFYQNRKKICKELGELKCVVENNYIRIFDYATYVSPYFYLKLSDQAKPLFLNLKGGFLSYQISNILKLSTVNSVRIYEIFHSIDGRFRYIKSTLYVDVDELKMILGLVGKYKEFNNFKKRVLFPSINLINHYTDYRYYYYFELENRSIKKIAFEPHINRSD